VRGTTASQSTNSGEDGTAPGLSSRDFKVRFSQSIHIARLLAVPTCKKYKTRRAVSAGGHEKAASRIAGGSPSVIEFGSMP
jgi:hypothetical protein